MTWPQHFAMRKKDAEEVRMKIDQWYHHQDLASWKLGSPMDNGHSAIRNRAQLDGPLVSSVFVTEVHDSDRERRYMVHGLFVDSNGDGDIYYWNQALRALVNSRGQRLE